MGALGAIVLAILVRMVVGAELLVDGFTVQSPGNNQMKEDVTGPDGVRYGCYGHVDPTNGKHQTYYVAGKMGYRTFSWNMLSARRADSVNKLDGSVQGKRYDESGVEWNIMYMPEPCFRLNEMLDNAASIQVSEQKVVAPHQPDTSHVQIQPVPPLASSPPLQTTQYIAQPLPPLASSPPLQTTQYIPQHLPPLASSPPLQTTQHIAQPVPPTTSSSPLQTTQHIVPTTPSTQVDEDGSTDRWDIDEYDERNDNVVHHD